MHETCRLPTDLLEDLPQTISLGWINRLHETDAAFQVGTKARMRFAILTLRTQACTVGKRRLETVKGRSRNIHALVGDQSRQMLANTLTHDARLAVMHGETFFEQDRGGVSGKSLCAPPEFLIAGKREIVSIASVLSARGLREAAQPAIRPVSTKIGE